MSDLEFLQPEGWAPPVGYANGVAARGRLVVVGGQIGWNPETCAFETDDFAAQTAQALRNIVAVLRAAGAEPSHIVRLTWFITDKAAYLDSRREIGRAYREILGRHFPAMAVMQIVRLVEPAARLEIEGTAVLSENTEDQR